jgi:hypothetical protein
MKIWAAHKEANGDKVTCPLCRSEFALTDSKMTVKRRRVAADEHADTECSHCKTAPIAGERYHCVVCHLLDLCAKCFRMGFHQNHPFMVKTRESLSWEPAEPIDSLFTAVLSQEVSPADYETMLSLNTKQSLLDFLTSVLLFTEHGTCVFCTLDQRHVMMRQLRCGHSCHEVGFIQTCLLQALTNNSCPVDGAQILPGLNSSKS